MTSTATMNSYEASQGHRNQSTTTRATASLLLPDLSVGQAAIVRAVNGTDSITARLLEMGLIPGTIIKLIGKAPLGDPLEYELRGYRLSLRVSEAKRVAIALEQ